MAAHRGYCAVHEVCWGSAVIPWGLVPGYSAPTPVCGPYRLTGLLFPDLHEDVLAGVPPMVGSLSPAVMRSVGHVDLRP